MSRKSHRVSTPASRCGSPAVRDWSKSMIHQNLACWTAGYRDALAGHPGTDHSDRLAYASGYVEGCAARQMLKSSQSLESDDALARRRWRDRPTFSNNINARCDTDTPPPALGQSQLQL